MLEKIGIGILTKFVPRFLKEAWERAKNRHQNSKNASHDYGSHYKKRHSQLIVACVGMEPARSLDDIYVAVQFLDKRGAATYGSIEDIENAFWKREGSHPASTSDEHHDGMRTANDEQYLTILGGPGVGKSMFLQKVGLEALKGEDGNFEHTCTPVFLELKRFTEDQTNIESWITQEFKVCGYPYPERMTKAALKSGELLILFDGLDEVPTPNINNVFNKIRDFVDQYSENRFIVSCRPAAYTGRFTSFAVVEIAEFDDSQIQAYINNWFALCSNRKTETAQRCWEALNTQEHQAIKALAQNPLSLALLCAIYEDSQNFPSNRTILYERILNIFLKKWTVEKHIYRDPPVSPYLDFLTVKEMLSEIAMKNFKANRVLFSEDELINQIHEFFQRNTNIPATLDASKTLDTILIDPGLFVERANGIYSFLHLTFQEYLTANYIVGDTRSIRDLVNQHLHDERWREVFLLTAGLMREADDLLVAMEAEAAKFINTPGLKSLFRWAKQMTDLTDDWYYGITKRLFALRQFFSLWLLNKMYEMFENVVNRDLALNRNRDPDQYLDLYFALDRYRRNRDPDPDQYLDLDLDLELYLARYFDLARYRDLDQELDEELALYFKLELYLGLDFDQDLNLDRYFDLEIDLGIFLYQDFYKNMDTDFYRSVSSHSRNQFDGQLQKQITFVKRMKDMKIFKQVNLQRMVRRLIKQQEFIKATADGKSVEPLTESIHDTWLSVLNITDDMLEISHEEFKAYVTYLRAAELIVACKKAAGRVSPDVWQKIEDGLLAWEIEESED